LILTVDLGTSLTKVALWELDGPVAIGRAAIRTTYGADRRAEQDPGEWWTSVVRACREAVGQAGGGAAVDAIGFSAARQTFVPVDSGMHPLDAGILWSDRRAGDEATGLASVLGGNDALRERTGIYVDAGAVAAKVAWLAVHEPERLRSARWLLAPRDLVIWRMTGELASDPSLASATGLFDRDGRIDGDLSSAVASISGLDSSPLLATLFPDVRPSSSSVGRLLGDPARELGLKRGTPVVVGAGDRSCEVIGTGASQLCPMVSWGTTANVSVPAQTRPEPVPSGMIVTRAGGTGWLIEGGLSAAGSLIEWIGSVTRRGQATLMEAGLDSPPGARGVLVTPWLGGARAPWWCDRANAAFIGLRPDAEVGDLVRAAVEGVALDVSRCIDSAGLVPGPAALTLAGGGAASRLWVEVVTGTTGLRAIMRRSSEAASVGAALLVARSLGLDADVDRMNPVESEVVPDAQVVETYRTLRPEADEVARSLIDRAKGPVS
jgi:xylulokinase